MPIDPQSESPSPILLDLLAALARAEEVRAESAALRLTAQLTVAELKAIRADAVRSHAQFGRAE